MSELHQEGRIETVGTPHYEIPCGYSSHGVVSFDSGRQVFTRLVNTDFHDVSSRTYGKTRTREQCGQWKVRSNGVINWISFPDGRG